MLSYPIAEALKLLETKLEASQTSYEDEIEKIAFIGEQITVGLHTLFPLFYLFARIFSKSSI